MATVEGATHIVRYVNPAFCRLLNKPREKLVGKEFSEMLPKKDTCVSLLDRVFRTGTPESHTEKEHSKPHPIFWSYTVWPVTADESMVGVMIQVTETAQVHESTVAMNEALMLGSLRQHELTEAAESLNARLRVEITERQKTARELAEKARLLDLSIDAIIVRDLDGKISSWNKGAEKLYGWTFKEVIGKNLYSLLQMEFPKPMEAILAQLQSEGHFSGEVLQIARDGRRMAALCRWVLDRGTKSILTSYTDITERKQVEEALRQAQSQLADRAKQLEGLVTVRTSELTTTNQQLETFAYSIAHDLRAPLRSMQGFSAMLVEEAGAALNETGKDYAHRINKSAQFMDALLSDLLAFSRISQQRVQMTSVNLKTVVESVLSRLQPDIQEKNARVESAGPWPVVLAHEPTLAQVLFNLASNALKFTAPGVPPRLRLRTEEIPVPPIQPSTNPIIHPSFVRVWVEDNGPGIAPDYQAQIFRLFTRLEGDKYAGTGIGLAIVQKGVERMGGRVGVESALGQGSRFWFELKKA